MLENTHIQRELTHNSKIKFKFDNNSLPKIKLPETWCQNREERSRKTDAKV
jgi:hypothetical protein